MNIKAESIFTKLQTLYIKYNFNTQKYFKIKIIKMNKT